MDPIKRVFLIVLDSFGIGWAPDAADFGDVGSNTLGSVAGSPQFDVPNMASMGLFNIEGVTCKTPADAPIGSYARLQEKSRGKDTTVGHWEIAGCISANPFPTYPHGFPAEVLDEFSRRTGRKALCNLPYSGTAAIMDFGREHVETGDLIVYTSADSVFQIAAHEAVVPIEQLYAYCEIAREILQGEHAVARVIARPFAGEYPNFYRTPRRHDFSLRPPQDTMLDLLKTAGRDVIGVGKIYDIFAGAGVTRKINTVGNDDGMAKTIALQDEDFHGLCFVNLVDFDMVYGHRNDIDGYAKALTTFDRQLGEFMNRMGAGDVLMITADHGCDPGFPGTDHCREYVPLLVYGRQIWQGIDLKTRPTFADVAATVLEIFDIPNALPAESFLKKIH